MKKALIAMSGGVDSSVAAKLMLDAGCDCMGATMKLFDSDDILMAQREKTCCSLSDVEDARSVARRLGMPYQVFNFKGDFKEKVIDKFIATYEAGGTPNPWATTMWSPATTPALTAWTAAIGCARRWTTKRTKAMCSIIYPRSSWPTPCSP